MSGTFQLIIAQRGTFLVEDDFETPVSHTCLGFQAAIFGSALRKLCVVICLAFPIYVTFTSIQLIQIAQAEVLQYYVKLFDFSFLS